MIRGAASTAFLFGLWLLLSGIYTPLVIGLGLISSIFVVYVTTRMKAIDGYSVDYKLKTVEFIKYLGWLMVEIAKANWAVTKIIVSPNMPLRQHLFSVGYTQKTDLGSAIYANSITLTPGTISVETEPGRFLIHAVSYSDSDLDALADMDRRVSATEEESPT